MLCIQKQYVKQTLKVGMSNEQSFEYDDIISNQWNNWSWIYLGVYSSGNVACEKKTRWTLRYDYLGDLTIEKSRFELNVFMLVSN